MFFHMLQRGVPTEYPGDLESSDSSVVLIFALNLIPSEFYRLVKNGILGVLGLSG